MVQTSKKIASSLWKNLPNSIYLVAKYKAIISSLFLINGNNAKNEIIPKKNNIIENIVEILATRLNDVLFSSKGGKKYNIDILEKANRLLNPVKNVVLNPLPKIGNRPLKS